jgi:hypothetical protein
MEDVVVVVVVDNVSVNGQTTCPEVIWFVHLWRKKHKTTPSKPTRQHNNFECL